MSYSRRALMAVVLVVGLAASNAAFAVDTFKFYGYVVDPLGRPLQGATVTDGSRNAITNSDGFYELPQSSLGTRTLTAHRFDTRSATKQYTIVLPRDVGADFQVSYRSRTEVVPREVESLPFSASIRSKAYGPLDGLCVTASDSRTGSTIPLTYQSTAGDGEHLFTSALEIPVDAMDGGYVIESISRDCVSGVALTATTGSSYVIWTDTVAPTGQILSPQAGHGYFQEDDKGPREDGRTTVFGTTGVRVSVQDNREVGGVYVYAVDADGNRLSDCNNGVPAGTTSTEVYCSLSLTALGPATIVVRIIDRQNNSTELEMPVSVGLYLL